MSNVRLYSVYLLCLTLFLTGCATTKINYDKEAWLPKKDQVACYIATHEGNTYVLGLYNNGTYVLGQNLAERISLGTCTFSEDGIHLNSFIQSFDKIPFVVNERSEVNSNGQIIISNLYNPFFIGAWKAKGLDKVWINNSERLSKGGRNFLSDFEQKDTLMLGASEKVEQIKITGSGFEGKAIEYQVKDPSHNHFEIYSLQFAADEFVVMNTVFFPKSPTALEVDIAKVDNRLEGTKLLFEKVDTPMTKAGISATAAGATLSGYKIMIAGGRDVLVKLHQRE
jgi:hypothetical protein